MKIIVAIDNSNGMMFHSRRQSSDSTLRQHILEMSKDSLLWMNTYTQKQFQSPPDYVRISDSFLTRAGQNEYCFVENESIADLSEKIEELILYRWNRKYPADFHLDFLPWEHGLHCISKEDFKGHSHDKISMEVWKNDYYTKEQSDLSKEAGDSN